MVRHTICVFSVHYQSMARHTICVFSMHYLAMVRHTICVFSVHYQSMVRHTICVFSVHYQSMVRHTICVFSVHYCFTVRYDDEDRVFTVSITPQSTIITVIPDFSMLLTWWSVCLCSEVRSGKMLNRMWKSRIGVEMLTLDIKYLTGNEHGEGEGIRFG